jgi:hypothetical protein
MSWTPGNNSGSQTLTDNDDLFATHINELRVAASGAVGAIASLASSSALKADDSSVVHKANAEIITGLKTFYQGAFQDKGNHVYDLAAYGAVFDRVLLYDGAITNGSKIVTSVSATFTSADVGKFLVIMGAGSGGGQLGGLIQFYDSPQQVRVQFAASTTVTGAEFRYGTDNSAARDQAVADAIAKTNGGIIQLPMGPVFFARDMSGYLKHYIHIRGAGMDITTVELGNGVAPLAFGTGDGSLTTTKRPMVTHLTINMCNMVGASYGLIFANTSDAYMECVRIKNQKNGAKSMLFWGLNTNSSSALKCRGLVAIDCIFEDSDASWEAVTLAQSLNAKFFGCKFGTKSAIYNFLNYGSYDVSMMGCEFYNCGNGVNGRGDSLFVGCNFFGAVVTNIAHNITYSACTWRNVPGTFQGGLVFIGNENSPTESGWDSVAGAIEVFENIVIDHCRFQGCNTASISSSLYLASDGLYHSPLYDITISNCQFSEAYWRGIDVAAVYIKIKDCKFKNNNQITGSSNQHNMGLSGKEIWLEGILSYDDQVSPTVTYDINVDRQPNTVAVYPTTDIYFRDNTFRLLGFRTYNGAFGVTPTNNTTLHDLGGNIGIVPEGKYAQGNVTGATTFNRNNGKIITATQTAAIVVTLTTPIFIDAELTLDITTGGFGQTWPANLKLVGGALAMTGRSLLTIRHDGTNWIEVSRALNVS